MGPGVGDVWLEMKRRKLSSENKKMLDTKERRRGVEEIEGWWLRVGGMVRKGKGEVE